MGNIYLLYKAILFSEKKNNRTLDSSDLKKLSTMDVAYNVYSIRKPNDLFKFLILPYERALIKIIHIFILEASGTWYMTSD